MRGGAARRAARRGAEEVVRRRGDARRRIIGARPRAGAQGCACVTWKSAVLGVFLKRRFKKNRPYFVHSVYSAYTCTYLLYRPLSGC